MSYGRRYIPPPTLTVKDIAEAIALEKSEQGVAKAMRQVRHWTENDILIPIGEKKTGTGIPRRYELEPTIQVAAVLAELARYGVSIEIMRPAAEAIYEEWENGGGQLTLAMSPDEYAALQVTWDEDPVTGALSNGRAIALGSDDVDFWGTLDLDSASSILINLNAIMIRIPWKSFGEWG